MAITASMVKELRQRTGAGMMECKKVLTATNGDIESAIEALRIKGVAAAEKKAGRIVAEGIIVSQSNGNVGAMVEVNCETDFVAKDDLFKGFCATLAETVLANDITDVDALAAVKLDSGVTVEQARQELIGKIGENISLRRFVRYAAEGAAVSNYLHGSRIGVMVQLEGGSDELGRDIAMHIAASNPLCVSEDEMDPAVLAKESDIIVAQARESGKPDDIIERMISERIKKFFKKNTLLGQPFVKNPDQTVAQLLDGAGARVRQMVRFEVGEGIEKKRDDFVAEVMAQAGI